MNEETLLLRQVNPSWVQRGRVTSQAFRPTPKDKSMLSVYDGDLIEAQDAWKHYTSKLQFDSVGAMAVSKAECTALDLKVQPDPKPFPEHALIDFSGFGTSQIEKKSKHLRAAARSRGWLYKADESQ